MVRGKTLTFTTSVAWARENEGTLASTQKPPIKVSAPPAFRGPEGNWSPEELYVGSVETCLMLTFVALAKSRKLEYAGYESTATGELEQVYGKFVVTKITVKPRVALKAEAERAKAQEVLGLLEEHCFISNSIESEVVIEPEVVVGG